MNNPIDFPFLFIGAGEATNFEWCYLFVRFKNPPDDAAMTAISKGSPLPIKVYEENFMGNMMHVGSSPYVNQTIESQYGDRKIPDGEKPEYYCSEKARRSFEAHIEKWLRETNSICPIEIAVRPEDIEAEGTRFSAWHDESVRLLPIAIEQWSKMYSQMNSKGERSFFKQMLEELVVYVPGERSAIQRILDKE